MDDQSLLTEETISDKIYFIRNQKVMLDSNLAMLYGVETKRVNEQVKRNLSRFPEDFMFQLTENEYDSLRSQIATLKKLENHDKNIELVFSYLDELTDQKENESERVKIGYKKIDLNLFYISRFYKQLRD
jgi:hypothetical protein